MPSALVIHDEALEDLDRMLEPVPFHRWDAILNSIGQLLAAFALAPTTSRTPRLVLPLNFVADHVRYRWEATWCYSQDAEAVRILGFGRSRDMIL